MLPSSPSPTDPTTTTAPDDFPSRPGFTVTAMSTNFRRFNARIGVVFRFQNKLLRLLSWRKPSHTLSLLSVYTFICLDPYLLTIRLIFVYRRRGRRVPGDEAGYQHE